MATYDFMDKHFAAAGIGDEDKSLDTGGVDSLPGNGEDSNVSRDSNEPDPIPPAGTEGQDSISGTNETPKESGQESPDQLKDSKGGGVDSGNEQGKDKEKGKGTSGPQALTLPDGTKIEPGKERRFYDSWQTERQHRVTVQQELNTVKQKYEALQSKYDQTEKIVKDIGLEDPQQMASAIRLYRDLKSEPLKAVKQLLVDLKAGGYNLDGIADGVDTAAINRMLDQRLPNTSVNGGGNQEEINKQAEAEAATELVNFYREHPDARLQEPFLAAVLDQNPDVSLEEAYFELKKMAIVQGYDWDKPLLAQVQERQKAPTTQGAPKDSAGTQQQKQQQQQRDPAPLGGRGVIADAGVTQEHNPNKILHQADSFEDAIRAGMRDAGINIQ